MPLALVAVFTIKRAESRFKIRIEHTKTKRKELKDKRKNNIQPRTHGKMGN